MSRTRHSLCGVAGVLVATALLVSVSGASATSVLAAPADMVLAVHADNPLQSVDKGTIRRILSGRTATWPNGETVVLVLPPKGSSAIEWMTKTVLGLPEKTYRRFLLQQVFRGVIKKPIVANNLERAIAVLKKDKGAIAVLPLGVCQKRGLKVLERK